MIDRELVTRKAVLILRDLDALGRLAALDRAAYLASRVDQAAAERYPERMIGRMIDVDYHLLTESGHAPPSDYYRSFVQLADAEVLEREFALRVAACASLRNRLVHDDDEDVDPSKVFDAMPAALRDIPEYLRRVDAFVQV